MRRPAALAAVLLVACAGLAAAPAATATCHLPSPGHCKVVGSDPCPATVGSVYVECPKVQLGQQDAVAFTVAGIEVVGQAFPTVIVQAAGDAQDYPIGSVVTLRFSARWGGNATHPDSLSAAYYFDARQVNWTSPPLQEDVAVMEGTQGFPEYPVYPFLFQDWSGANTTFLWTFELPGDAKVGTLRIPVAFAVRGEGRESSAQGELVLNVVSAEVDVIPTPFWRDPSFILLVGIAIGLAVGYIVFGRPRPAALRALRLRLAAPGMAGLSREATASPPR